VITGHAGIVFDVAVSQDGQRVAAAGDDGTVRVWTVHGTPLATLRGYGGRANGVRFLPDGMQVVTAGQDGTVRTWDVSTSALLLTQVLYGAAVSSIDVSGDGRIVVSATEAGSTLRTSTCDVCGPLDQVVAIARSRPIRTLTPDEELRWAS
jgi:WD40 repeat protein